MIPTPFRQSWLALWVCILVAVAAAPAGASGLEPWTLPHVSPLRLPTLSGDRIDLAEVGNRIVLVHFFATWCEPCRDELASLDRLAQHFGGRAQILAIDVGEPEARIRKFFEGLPVRFPVLLDADRSAMKAWEVITLPSTFVIGADGRPRLQVQGDLDWTATAIVEQLQSTMNQ
jgi:thiol-disulfide isomerase/thioredoxin